MGRSNFRGECGAFCCNQLGLVVYAKVREAIDMPFGVVSWVGPGIGELDGCPHASRGKEV